MLPVLCRADSSVFTIRKIAIAQFVLYAVLISLCIFGSIYYKDELPHDPDEPPTVFTGRLYMVLGVLHIVPLALAIMLYVGVVMDKLYYVRSYIFVKIFESIINTLIFLSMCILYALEVELYFAILLCVAPIFIGIWSWDSLVVVNEYYNVKTKLPVHCSRNPAEISADKKDRLKAISINNNDSTLPKDAIKTISTKAQLPNSGS